MWKTKIKILSRHQSFWNWLKRKKIILFKTDRVWQTPLNMCVGQNQREISFMIFFNFHLTQLFFLIFEQFILKKICYNLFLIYLSILYSYWKHEMLFEKTSEHHPLVSYSKLDSIFIKSTNNKGQNKLIEIQNIF